MCQNACPTLYPFQYIYTLRPHLRDLTIGALFFFNTRFFSERLSLVCELFSEQD